MNSTQQRIALVEMVHLLILLPGYISYLSRSTLACCMIGPWTIDSITHWMVIRSRGSKLQSPWPAAWDACFGSRNEGCGCKEEYTEHDLRGPNTAKLLELGTRRLPALCEASVI